MHIHTFVLTAEFLFIYWQWTWITANISVGQPGITDWQGPVLYQCPLMAVSRTTALLICCTHGIGAATNTVECFALLRFISKMLEYLLNKSLKTVKSLQQKELIQITSTTSSLSRFWFPVLLYNICYRGSQVGTDKESKAEENTIRVRE